MIELVGSIGWGLLVCGSITHVWHQARLRKLLAMHLDNDRLPAMVLTAVEVVLSIAVAVGFLSQHSSLRWFAIAAALVAFGFMVWIARLLMTGSDLPCACSFSEAPTSVWSLARAMCVGLVGLFALLGTSTDTGTLTERIATLAVGWAVASAIFVLPEAISWPPASKALLARVDAHVSSSSTSSSTAQSSS